jgi:hypothetical protein
MSQTMMQAILWAATFAVLVMFLQRRKKRRANS